MARNKAAGTPVPAVPAPRVASVLETLIVEVFQDYEKYLPSPQDVHLYRRKLREYAEEIERRVEFMSEDSGDGRNGGNGIGPDDGDNGAGTGE